MKKLLMLLLLAGLYFYGFAQDQDSSQIEETNIHLLAKEFREADYIDKNTQRHLQLWQTRLYPSGDYSTAAKAIIEYARDFHKNAHSGNRYRYSSSPNWRSLGPKGTNGTAIFTGGKGIGRINRITFSPDYWTDQTVYAVSTYGGVWRTVDDGQNWEVIGTDTQLPMTAVSDIATVEGEPETLFISTGEADFRIPYQDEFGSRPQQNSLFTMGIYRGEVDDNDGTVDWFPINGNGTNNFLDHFEDGGTTQKIIARNTSNGTQVLVATSKGIFASDNADESAGSQVDWTLRHVGQDPKTGKPDDSHRGLAFHPTQSNTIYASGKDIYVSYNNGATFVISPLKQGAVCQKCRQSISYGYIMLFLKKFSFIQMQN